MFLFLFFRVEGFKNIKLCSAKAYTEPWQRESKDSLHRLPQHLSKPRKPPYLLFLLLLLIIRLIPYFVNFEA